MAYTMEDFRREFREELLQEATPEERLKGLSAEEILKAVPPEKIEQFIKKLKGDKAEE